MKGKFLRSYRKASSGNNVFVYTVTGTEEQLAQYKEIQKENYVEDDKTGKPLWFSTRYYGDNIDLVITAKGNVVPDTSEFDKAASLASQYGGNLGTEIAKIAAGNLLGVTQSAPTQPVTQPTSGPENTGKDGKAGKKADMGEM